MASRKVSVKDTDKGYKDLQKRVEEAKTCGLSVGVTGESGAGTEKGSQMTVLGIATIHEFGLGVPERSFIRGWFDVFQGTAADYIKRIMAAVVDGKYTKTQGLELLGVRFQGECQKFMTDGTSFLPLAQVTIDRKGSSKPLINFGQLRSAITYRIETS